MSDNFLKDNGIFYQSESALSEAILPCDFIQGEKFSACYRSGSCWMKTAFVDSVGELPAETQYLLAKREEGYTLYFALCDDKARASFFGENGKAYCRVETGDRNMSLGAFRYAYAFDCDNPYEGLERAYALLRTALGSFRLKKEKKSPEFIDYLGYCTYNAFYDDITHEKIVGVDRAFCEEGLQLGFIIADAGWMVTADNKLNSFYADEKKFPEGLKKTVETCTTEYGLKHFLCWHTYNGYWKGLDAQSFPQYEIKEEKFLIPDRLKTPENADGFAATAGEDFYPMNIAYQDNGICQRNIEGAYLDFYRALQEQGATGAKIDAITWAEAFAEGKGGRVPVMKKLLRAIENASEKVFGGNHINCSSCSNDFFMNLGSGSLVRTSCDYMPDKPLTHLAHVVDNAFVGMWVEPIAIADWDMFESGCTWGSFHATARAASGAPVYCTDRPEKANFALLRKLATADGRVGRCKRNAAPTRACLMGTPKGEPFRVWNTTDNGLIIAAFGGEDTGATVQIPLAEAEGIAPGRYAVYSSKQGFIGVLTERDSLSCALTQTEAELFTIVKVEKGKAVLGWTEKLNSSAYVQYGKPLGGKLGVYTDEHGFTEVTD